MKKYIATIAVTATAEVEITLSPEEQEEFNNLHEADQEHYILDHCTIKPEDIDHSDGLSLLDLEES